MLAHHLTIRVPWHDAGWAGTVCKHPRENTSCLVLSCIGTSRNDAAGERCAGQRLDGIKDNERPPCKGALGARGAGGEAVTLY